jgi:hypothetical protein
MGPTRSTRSCSRRGDASAPRFSSAFDAGSRGRSAGRTTMRPCGGKCSPPRSPASPTRSSSRSCRRCLAVRLLRSGPLPRHRPHEGGHLSARLRGRSVGEEARAGQAGRSRVTRQLPARLGRLVRRGRQHAVDPGRARHAAQDQDHRDHHHHALPGRTRRIRARRRAGRRGHRDLCRPGRRQRSAGALGSRGFRGRCAGVPARAQALALAADQRRVGMAKTAEAVEEATAVLSRLINTDGDTGRRRGGAPRYAAFLRLPPAGEYAVARFSPSVLTAPSAISFFTGSASSLVL